VADAVKASQIMALAQAYAARAAGGGTAATPDGAPASVKVVNMLAIAAPQQVMLEVKIAEVSKSLVDQLGASLGVNVQVGNWTHSLLSNLLSGNRSLIEAFNNKNGNFVKVDAQKRDGLVKILAEPTIMAISGQEASSWPAARSSSPSARTTTAARPASPWKRRNTAWPCASRPPCSTAGAST
jgi:pilus assembly protein CpaC